MKKKTKEKEEEIKSHVFKSMTTPVAAAVSESRAVRDVFMGVRGGSGFDRPNEKKKKPQKITSYIVCMGFFFLIDDFFCKTCFVDKE